MGRARDEDEEVPRAKRARGPPGEPEEEEPEAEEEEEEEKVSSRKARKGVVAERQQLEPGAVVLYWGDWRGVIHDAFEALDNYWVADEESGEVVRDEHGEIVTFNSLELKLVAPTPKLQDKNPCAPQVGVLILGNATQMMKVLEHFGPPDPDKRTEPQELLAIPCSLCDPSSLLKGVREGVNPTTLKLAQGQRPDLHVALRAYHLRYAVEQCISLMRLEEYFCLAGVNVPYSEEEIKAGKDKHEKRWRRSVANQLDVGVTAYGLKESETATLLETAQQAVGRSCGMCLSEVLWQEAAQSCIRKNLGVPELPLHFTDAMGAKVHVLVLPEDASITDEGGIISFHEAFASDYANLGLEAEADAETKTAETAKAAAPAKEPATVDVPEKPSDKPQEKTVSDWEKEQEKFADQAKLPEPWIRILSKKTGKVYFFNKETQESSFEMPLPEGWVKVVSKSTGKTYYFNAQSKKSTFVRPTE